MNTIFSTPIKVGMCFGIPYKKGIEMVLIISISTVSGVTSVHYAYFSSGKFEIRKTHYYTGALIIKDIWDQEKVILL